MTFTLYSQKAIGMRRDTEKAEHFDTASRNGGRNKLFKLGAGILLAMTVTIVMLSGSRNAIPAVVKRTLLAPEPRSLPEEAIPHLRRTKVYTLTNGTTPTTNTTLPTITSPCDNNSSAYGSFLQVWNPIGGFFWEYELFCNTFFKAIGTGSSGSAVTIKQVVVPDMQGCIEACAAYNAGLASSPVQQLYCYEVSIIKEPGEFCYLKTFGGWVFNETYGHPSDSAILISD